MSNGRSSNINLVGYVGNEIELKTTSTGKKVLNISVSENIVSGRGNERKTRTIWHKIVLWEKAAEHHAKYIKKGDKITIMGGNLDYETREIGEHRISQAFIANPQIFYSKNNLKINMGDEGVNLS
ncbi:MAG: single-stranded DNA-binding protein [Bacteriovoracaceae bacterium]|nr:single-stranded DNA-binding protein [Bacteriovoracaceae bacterium]